MYDNDNIEEYDVSEEWLDYIEAVADELDKQRNEEAKQLEELRKQTEIEKENTAKAKRKTARMRKQADEHFSDAQVSSIIKNDFEKQKKLERERSKALKEKNRAIGKAVGGAFGKTGRAANSVLGLSEISTAAAAITGVTAAFTALTTAAIKVTRATASYNQEMSASAAALGGVSNDSSGLTESLRGLSNAWSLLNEAIGNSKFGEFVEQFNKFVTEGLLGAAAWINTGNPANDYKAGATKYENWATALSQQYGVEYSKSDILKMFSALMYGKSDAGFGGDVAEAFGQKMTEKIIDYGAMHEGVNVTQMAAEYASMLKNGGTSKYSGVAIDDKIINALAYQKYGYTADVLGERPRQQLIAEEINRQHELAAKGDTKALLDSQAALRQFGEIIRDVGKSLFAFDEVINVSAKLYDAEESLGGFDNKDSNNLEDIKDDTKHNPDKIIPSINDIPVELRPQFELVASKIKELGTNWNWALEALGVAVRERDGEKVQEIGALVTAVSELAGATNSGWATLADAINNLVGAMNAGTNNVPERAFPSGSAWDGEREGEGQTVSASSEYNKEYSKGTAGSGAVGDYSYANMEGYESSTADALDAVVAKYNKNAQNANGTIDKNKWAKVREIASNLLDTKTAAAFWSWIGQQIRLNYNMDQSSFEKSLQSGAAWSILNTPFSAFAFAKGGVVNGPTNALIGEAGREAVIPLENSGGIEYLKNALIEAGAGNGGNTTVNVTISGQILEMNDYNVNKLANRIGAAIDNYTNRRGGINYTK